MTTYPTNMLLKKIINLPKTDFIFFYQGINRYWLTGFSSSDGLILINKKKNSVQVFLDSRYYQEGKETLSFCQVLPLEKFLPIWKNQKGTVTIEHDLPYFLVQKLKHHNNQLKLQPTDINSWRIVKNQEEIAKLRKVCHLTAQIWKRVIQFVEKHNQLSEKDVAQFIREQFFVHGIFETAFSPIVATDTNSAFIHTQPKETLLKSHLLCDFGGKLDEYCSDFSRTLILDEKSPIVPYFNFVVDLQKKVIAKLKPGLSIRELVNYVNKLYQNAWKDSPYLVNISSNKDQPSKKKLTLVHALGHGIGLKVHEQPFLSSNSELVLLPGMVLTIEPGVYLSQLGGVRIEDVVLITEKGCEVLTS